MPDAINAQKLTFSNALATPFGDAPLGKLGAREAAVETPDVPRTRLESVGNQIKTLVDRAVEVLTPATARAAREVREAAKVFSGHLGDALGAMSATETGMQDKELAAAAINALVADAQILVPHGVAFEEALALRLDMHLDRLDKEQLVALVKGSHSEAAFTMLLGLEQGQPPQHEAGLTISLIANRAAAKLMQVVERELAASLASKLEDSVKILKSVSPERFVDPFPSLAAKVVAGLTLLTDTGAMSLPPGMDAFANGYLKEALGKLPQADLSCLLMSASPQELKTFSSAASPHGEPLDAVNTALAKEIGERPRRLADKLGLAEKSIAGMLNGATPASAPADGGVAVGVILDSARLVAELADHVKVLGLAVELKSPQELQALCTGVETLIEQHPEFLSALSTETSGTLNKALAQLELAGPQARVVADLEGRREAAKVAMLKAISSFAATTRSGALHEVLDQAAAADKAFGILSAAHQALDSTPVDVDEQKAHSQTRFNEAIVGLSPQDANALKTFFAQSEAQNLAIACADLAAVGALSRSEPSLWARVSSLSDILKMTAQAAASPVPERTAEVALSSVGANLSEQASSAIFRQFGIAIGTSGKSPVPARFQRAFAEHYLTAIPSSPAEADARFNRWFEADCKRAAYTLAGTVMSKKDPAGLKSALLVFSGTPEVAMEVSRVANQMLPRGVYSQLLNLENGAIRLSNGKSIRPLGGDAAKNHMAFEIGRNPAGEITVTAIAAYTDISRVSDPNGVSVDIVPGAEIHFTVGMTFSADREWRVSSPPEFQFSRLFPA